MVSSPLRMIALLPILLSCAAPASARDEIGFAARVLERHLIEGAPMVEVPDAKDATFGGIRVRVTIAPDGRVIDARVVRDSSEKADPAAALAAARAWRFRPFDYRGRPVTASGTVSVTYRPRGVWAKADAAFPEIDYANLKIELVRTACFGSCPDYVVSIDGTGKTLFTTQGPASDKLAALFREHSFGRGVLIPGRHEGTIDRAALDALIGRFRDAHFFGLKKSYFYGATDNPTYVLRFRSGRQAMEVTDYIGEAAGMPHVVHELEEAVDKAAGTERWIEGNAATVPALVAAGVDPTSPDAGYLALASIDQGDGLALALLDAGLDPDMRIKVRSAEPDMPLGTAMLVAAIGEHRPALFRVLAGRGWLARTPPDALARAFATGAGGCDAGMIEALIGAGVKPDVRDAEGKTALINATESYSGCDAGKAETAPAMAALIRLGADVNAVDDKGETALFGLEEPALQELLLAAGARIDIRAKDGTTALESSWDDRTALGLLDAGAIPGGKDDDGKTLRQIATEHDMPATLAWLDAHQIK